MRKVVLNPIATSSRSHQIGFSLVEALVALVVLSIGMLGIAALYVDSLRNGRTALRRTQAVTLAADMADKIRANRGAIKDFETVVTSTDTNTACAPGGTGCSRTALALHDKALWIYALQDAIPGATGTITVTGTTAPAIYTIVITWPEGAEVDPVTRLPVTNQYQMSFEA